MTDLIFLIAILLAVGIGAHMIARPEYHASRGTGAFANPQTIRTTGIVCVIGGVLAFLVRTILS